MVQNSKKSQFILVHKFYNKLTSYQILIKTYKIVVLMTAYLD